MKKVFVLAVLITLVAAGSAMALIANSAHDFSAQAWAGNEICQPCHTPHNALGSALSPLWNHELSTATYTPYVGYDIDHVAPTSAVISASISGLCLSCHDGTVALENFGGATGGTTFVTGNFLLDADLTDDHPIAFTYDAALSTADGELQDPTTALSTLGGTISADMLSAAGAMDCSSCHDVHNTNVPAASLLRIDNTGSALCIVCHIK